MEGGSEGEEDISEGSAVGYDGGEGQVVVESGRELISEAGGEERHVLEEKGGGMRGTTLRPLAAAAPAPFGTITNCCPSPPSTFTHSSPTQPRRRLMAARSILSLPLSVGRRSSRSRRHPSSFSKKARGQRESQSGDWTLSDHNLPYFLPSSRHLYIQLIGD